MLVTIVAEDRLYSELQSVGFEVVISPGGDVPLDVPLREHFLDAGISLK
jgi:hypothetical protein